MRFFKRAFLVIFLGLPGLALVLAGGGYLWLRTSLPQTEGTLRLAGPTAPIEVLRDSRGIPHIRAESEGDAYFALGFVHAQDRMWQMEMMRRIAHGRLAEMGGVGLLDHDKAMRTLDIAGLARDGLLHLSAAVKASLAAYAKGVNAWLESRGGTLPPEFHVVGITPGPWKMEDSLLWGRLMALRLSSNWRREAMRAELLKTLPPEKVIALWPPYPADAPVTIPAPARNERFGNIDPPKPTTLPDLPYRALAGILAPPHPTSASNTWVLSGSRTRSGKPILAGDPHLGFSAPNLWYLARLSYPGLSLAGATLPGVPFHILGQNGSIAWSMTTTGADTQDLVVETLDPDDPGRYRSPAGVRPFATRIETIRVKGEDDLRFTVRATRNGPVVSDLVARDGTRPPPNAVIALRSAMLIREDHTPDALYRLNRARNWDDFRAALKDFHSPVQNFVYGDVAGHIGFQLAGRIPMRMSGDGYAPVRGTDPLARWRGYIPFDRLPSVLDPEAGFLVNANNRVIGPGYPFLITRDWDAPYRAKRIVEALTSERNHDAAASARLQMDDISLAAREAIPLLLSATPARPDAATARALLNAWDGSVKRNRPEPLILHAWLGEAMTAIVGDEIGAGAGRARRWDPRFLRHVLERDPTWCDDIATEVREACGPVLADALDRALAGLRRRFGAEIGKWRWGKVHIASFRNRPLTLVPLIGHLADIEIATDGDGHTVNRGSIRESRRRGAFTHAHGATYRAIYDFADLDRSRFMMPGGQSGNPLSPHYRDLTVPWRDGGGLAIPQRPQGPLRRLLLRPGT